MRAADAAWLLGPGPLLQGPGAVVGRCCRVERTGRPLTLCSQGVAWSQTCLGARGSGHLSPEELVTPPAGLPSVEGMVWPVAPQRPGRCRRSDRARGRPVAQISYISLTVDEVVARW